ncbi:unnamed protein product [Pleuronectes platessa]|uniref:Uncharacterized protein n=1 Tax=Pleuronectes platessa TaxID=8262 RepID=A0A9N7YST1_PLEPL|nr:unnamed protein product [Pleuronectes platessa]
MINDENETYPADVVNPEPVCEVSGSTASLAVSCPGTARVQPATEQPSARCRHRRALIAISQAAAANRKQTPTNISEPLTWSQQPADIAQRARAEEGAWAHDLPRPQALFPPPLTPLPGWLASPLG